MNTGKMGRSDINMVKICKFTVFEASTSLRSGFGLAADDKVLPGKTKNANQRTRQEKSWRHTHGFSWLTFPTYTDLSGQRADNIMKLDANTNANLWQSLLTKSVNKIVNRVFQSELFHIKRNLILRLVNFSNLLPAVNISLF